MNELKAKYQEAIEAEERYRDAPRKGWVKPGSRSRENQTIEVPRKEAERLAADLASARFGSYCRLYENMALVNYMEQLAEDEPDAVACPKCYHKFLPGWMGGKCPYCAAEDAAQEKVEELLGGGEA